MLGGGRLRKGCIETYGVIGMLDRIREPRLDGVAASCFDVDAEVVETPPFCASSFRNCSLFIVQCIRDYRRSIYLGIGLEISVGLGGEVRA